MLDPTTHVHSPAGIRLISGLLGPYLTAAGQSELSARWRTSIDDLFTQAIHATETLADTDTLHAALGVWVRNHQLPPAAAAQLDAFIRRLPDDPDVAQSRLDAWAHDHTAGMIEAFPCTVTRATRAVLASAIAVDDTWACDAEDTRVRFGDSSVAGFEATTRETHVRGTADGEAVRATLPLSSGLEMTFCLHQEGPEAAFELVTSSPNYFFIRPNAGHPMLTELRVHVPTDDVAVLAPTFAIRTNLDLMTHAAEWGLVSAFQPDGVPGLGGLEVSEAKQDALIEVSHTGVRAAAVTAMTMRAGSATIVPKHRQLAVQLDRPFAFSLTHPDIAEPLFTGIYAG